MTGKEMKNKKNANDLIDPKVNVKIIIAALWASHFLLWTFGDMVSLLQDLNEPVANELLMFVAAPLALLQASMIFISLIGKARIVRLANLVVAPIFILLNIGFLTESKFGWEFLIGIGYIAVNVIIIGYAWKWPRVESRINGGI